MLKLDLVYKQSFSFYFVEISKPSAYLISRNVPIPSLLDIFVFLETLQFFLEQLLCNAPVNVCLWSLDDLVMLDRGAMLYRVFSTYYPQRLEGTAIKKILWRKCLKSRFSIKSSARRPSRRPEVFCRKAVLKNFAKYTGKHLCQSLLFNKVSSLRLESLQLYFK